MVIIGISAFYHDSAACIVVNGKLLAAAQEERFTRIKHDPSFPKHAILFCLQQANLRSEQVDYFVFYEKPFLKFERLLETYFSFAPFGFKSFCQSMPVWIKGKLFQKKLMGKALERLLDGNVDWEKRLLFSEHHLSHAASAFYPSPFNSAAILTLDGVGEWTTTSTAVANGNQIEFLKEMKFPHSLGLLYSAFTYHAGFKVNSGEYKLMGLAPFGEPKYASLIKDKLIAKYDDGSFMLNLKYFNFPVGLTMTNKLFDGLFDGPPRKPEAPITKREMDLAASIQSVTEEIVLDIASHLAKETGQKNLCMAGGVALNCVANGLLLENKIFEKIWIQPAAGDAGGALGAALSAWYSLTGSDRKVNSIHDSMQGGFLGPFFSETEIEASLKKLGAVFTKSSNGKLIEKVCDALEQDKAIGWMQGRMEFGPRALGNRSIIANPMSKKAQKQLNLKIKYRESFRPFAPSIIRDQLNKWFDLDSDSPYMLMVSRVKKEWRVKSQKKSSDIPINEKINAVRSKIPAVTHIDYSARIQTVHRDTNERFYELIEKFHQRTGCPIVVNTSFNVRGEPIVCTPEDAFNCFMGTDLDLLIIENFILCKKKQNKSLIRDYKNKYQLD